ncbi:antirepressor protein [Clostridium botulinum B str. Osaka05]|uniref:Antirepressor protein n=1 Tax=Clostridium botulinum B str. Osaka05 TaxID=1407017 RepID=A0A060N3B6_CLOBO|nr:phage antirepressor KilAC domain-containing protein [Clostridium botulinum]BAO04986.1 antirepressor protein [Clostridium botulinum B str. Osaka05]
MKNEELKLFTDGKVKAGEREFTRLIGGFGKDKPMFLLWQAGELLGQETREVTQNFERNRNNFDERIDFIDLKSLITENDKTETVDITSFFKSIGITHHKYGRASQWLAFSFSGMMKLVKIATTKESWAIYDRFLENYFKTKAENKVMKKTLDEEKEFLTERKKFILGSMFMEQDEQKRMDLFRENETISNRIKEIDVVLNKEKVIQELQPKIKIADSVTHTNNCYDLGTIAKILNIKNMGRNNLFKWLKEKEILMDNNAPYQRYIKYFKVITVTNRYTNMANNKTLLRPNGVEYIVKKLIDDNKIITKPVNETLEELEQTA